MYNIKKNTKKHVLRKRLCEYFKQKFLQKRYFWGKKDKGEKERKGKRGKRKRGKEKGKKGKGKKGKKKKKGKYFLSLHGSEQYFEYHQSTFYANLCQGVEI